MERKKVIALMKINISFLSQTFLLQLQSPIALQKSFITHLVTHIKILSTAHTQEQIKSMAGDKYLSLKTAYTSGAYPLMVTHNEHSTLTSDYRTVGIFSQIPLSFFRFYFPPLRFAEFSISRLC